MSGRSCIMTYRSCIMSGKSCIMTYDSCATSHTCIVLSLGPVVNKPATLCHSRSVGVSLGKIPHGGLGMEAVSWDSACG